MNVVTRPSHNTATSCPNEVERRILDRCQYKLVICSWAFIPLPVAFLHPAQLAYISSCTAIAFYYTRPRQILIFCILGFATSCYHELLVSVIPWSLLPISLTHIVDGVNGPSHYSPERSATHQSLLALCISFQTLITYPVHYNIELTC